MIRMGSQHELRGGSWWILKSVFLLEVIILFAGSITLIYGCFILGKIIHGDQDYARYLSFSSDPYVAQVQAKVSLGYIIPIIIFDSLQAITGLIGIITTKASYLYFFTGMAYISAATSFICFFIILISYGRLINILNAMLQSLLVLVTPRIIKMINRANGE